MNIDLYRSAGHGRQTSYGSDDPRLGYEGDDPSVREQATTRILLVDDHPVVRQGIKQILTEAFEAVQVGEAADAETALAEVRANDWDIVVLDISMPGVSGLEVLRKLRRARRELPILVLSMHPAEQFARRAMSRGASGYLTKHSGPRELVQAIQTVIVGGVYLDPQIDSTRESEGSREQGRPPHEALSDREYQVLRMFAQGKTVTQIAAEISVSVKTVSTFRRRVLEKMQMRTNAEIIRYAILNRLVD